MKSVVFLREEYMLEHIEDMMNDLSRKGLFTHQWEHFHINRKRNADIFISMVLTSPKELLKGFKQYLQDQEYDDIQMMIDSQSVTLKDKTVLSELEGSMTGKCLRPNGGKPLIKFTSQQRDLLLRELENANDIAASLLSKMIISGNEFLKISLQHAGRMGTTVLLDILEKCSENHLVHFYSALEENGYNPSNEKFPRIKQFFSKYYVQSLYGAYDEYTSRYQPVFTPGHFGHYPLGTYGGGYKPATISSEKQTSQKDSKQEVETILRRRQEIITKQTEYQHAKTKVPSLKAAQSEPDILQKYTVPSLKAAQSEPDILQKVTDIADPFMETDSDEEFESFDELWMNIPAGQKGKFQVIPHKEKTYKCVPTPDKKVKSS